MKRAGLICKSKRKFKATTDSKHNKPIAPNRLERQFNVDKPDQHYAGDITYIETQAGWLYLAVVIDLYFRQVVGWSMSKRMKAALVNDALLMAIFLNDNQMCNMRHGTFFRNYRMQKTKLRLK